MGVASRATTDQDGGGGAIPPGDRALILTGVLLALFLGALDQTIVSTALPRIAQDLGGLERYAWVATSYLLASTCFVPIYGRLADLVSRRTIESWAIGLFLSGSALCGMAGEFGALPVIGDGMNQLILFRAIQGAGGAGLFAMAFIVIADLYPPAERGRYQGFVGAVFGISSILGPLLGGLLTDHAGGVIPGVEGWRWVFYVNLPFGALALWFIITRMPPLEPRETGRLDPVAAGLLLAGLLPLFLGLQLDRTRFPWIPGVGMAGASATPVEGWATAALLGTSAILLLLFTRRTLASRDPILDLALFRVPVFRIGVLCTFLFGASFLSILFFLPLFMVQVVGVSATAAGISIMPLSLGVVAGSVAAGQLASRLGRYRGLMLLGGGALLVGVILLAAMDAQVSRWEISLYMILCGVGLGPSFPLFTLAVQNGVDVRRVGQATGAVQFFRQLGGTVGTAVMGTVLAAGVAGATLVEGTAAGTIDPSLRSAFADSITTIYALTAGVVVLALLATVRIPDLPLRKTLDRG